MVRSIGVLVLFFLTDVNAYGQTLSTIFQTSNPVIDSLAITQWEQLGTELHISNNGKYFVYNIEKPSLISRTVIVQSVLGGWKKEFPGASSPFITQDSRQIVLNIGDSLCLWNLGTNDKRFIAHVVASRNHQVANDDWLSYRLKSNPLDLILLNLRSGNELIFRNIQQYIFTKKTAGILAKKTLQNGTHYTTSLQWINLRDNHTTDIYSTTDQKDTLDNFSTDKNENQVLFTIISEKNGGSSKSIWYFKRGMKKSIQRYTSQSLPIELGYSLGDATFSENCQYIFISMNPTFNFNPLRNRTMVDVWSHSDSMLQCEQLFRKPEAYRLVGNIDNDKVFRLERANEQPVTYQVPGDFMVIKQQVSSDRFWDSSEAYKPIYWLVSLKNGSRVNLNVQDQGYTTFHISPANKYVVYYDPVKGDYYSYELKTGKIVNISKAVPKRLLTAQDEYNVSIKSLSFPVGIGGWLNDAKGILVYDNYDVWLLDPAGLKRPRNITNGYGRANSIKFRLVYETDYYYNQVIHEPGKELLLTAFNVKNKYNGYFRKQIGKDGNPHKLTMGPFTYFYHIGSQVTVTDEFSSGMKPLKARKADVWIVRRESADEAPNYWSTKNFIAYKQLTNLQPHQNYNWMTAEMISFKQLDGTTSQGVLYKPASFDSTKKYPVLFNYYQQFSSRIHQYPRPNFTRHNINIPWFVSHGYLVFTPDIYYIDGKAGKGEFNTMVGAAQYLATLAYVNSNRIGINGHSTGGFETNYLVSHTNIFAAALAGAGGADEISAALQLSGTAATIRGSRLRAHESKHQSLPWIAPKEWIEYSPIMQANRVTTPLLLLHNIDDTAVPWEQSVEFFIALRRENKKVWMLQYDGDGHTVSFGQNAMDFTKRITQFFDHYLKGAPPPKWMTQGRPASLKGIDDRFELDPDGECGTDCKICREKNYKDWTPIPF